MNHGDFNVLNQFQAKKVPVKLVRDDDGEYSSVFTYPIMPVDKNVAILLGDLYNSLHKPDAH